MDGGACPWIPGGSKIDVNRRELRAWDGEETRPHRSALDVPKGQPDADKGSEAYCLRLATESANTEHTVYVECKICQQSFVCGLFYCPSCIAAKKYAVFKYRAAPQARAS